MKRIDPLNGRFEFSDLGVGKFSETVTLKGESDLWKVIRSKVMSADVDWSYDSVLNEGKIWVGGFRSAGTFKKVP